MGIATTTHCGLRQFRNMYWHIFISYSSELVIREALRKGEK